MKRLALAALLTAGITCPALASPATDLTQQALFYLEFYYAGYSQVDPKTLADRFLPEVEQACANQQNTCPYEVARPIIEKMADALKDGHTYYISPEEFTAENQAQAGQSSSQQLRLGITTMPIKGSSDRLLLRVRQDGPAEAAGLKRGDRIIALNGKALAEYGDNSGSAVAQAVQTGKPLQLTVLRGPERTQLEFTLRGIVFKEDELPSMRVTDQGVGIIYIPTFDAAEKVGNRVHTLVRQAQTQGLKALVVDLRDDLGGLAQELVGALSAFIPDLSVVRKTRFGESIYGARNGTVYFKDLTTAEEQVLYRINNPTHWQGPLAVVVNGDSASAAEYFPSFIQRYKLGTIIGEPTNGAGNTVRQAFPLIDGSAIAVTTGRSNFSDNSPLPERVTPDQNVTDDLDELAHTGRDLPMETALKALGFTSPLTAVLEHNLAFASPNLDPRAFGTQNAYF